MSGYSGEVLLVDDGSAAAPVLVNVKWAHHANGGYGALADFLAGEVIEYPQTIIGASPGNGARRAIDLIRFNRQICKITSRFTAVHLLYGDSIIAPGLFGAKNLRIICTVHLPLSDREPSRAPDILRDRVLRRADGIVVLSSEEVYKARRRFPSAEVEFIPHGLDLRAFPSESLKCGAPNFAVVGSNLRDWQTLDSILREALGAYPDWLFHLVGVSAEFANRWASHRRVICHDRLSNPEYLRLVGASWGVLLPLRGSTANNAILESHAMGTPVVATDLSSVRDYACETTRLFKSAKEAIACLAELSDLNDASRLQEAQISRVAARRFDWNHIAARTTELYRRLDISGPRSRGSA